MHDLIFFLNVVNLVLFRVSKHNKIHSFCNVVISLFLNKKYVFLEINLNNQFTTTFHLKPDIFDWIINNHKLYIKNPHVDCITQKSNELWQDIIIFLTSKFGNAASNIFVDTNIIILWFYIHTASVEKVLEWYYVESNSSNARRSFKKHFKTCIVCVRLKISPNWMVAKYVFL